MLPLIVALFWLAVLIPWAVVKYRNRAERSIDSFAAEHEVLSRQGYSVTPARRLDDAYLYEEQAYEPAHEPERSRPRLTVVRDDDTYSTIEQRVTWDEWEHDYDYERNEEYMAPQEDAAPSPGHRYAAYAHTPSGPTYDRHEFEPFESAPAPLHHTMRVRRHRIAAGLVALALVASAADVVLASSIAQDLVILTWLAVALYVAAAFFAVSVGYLEVASLLGRRVVAYAPVEAGYGEYDQYADEQFDLYDEPEPTPNWTRETRRYALG